MLQKFSILLNFNYYYYFFIIIFLIYYTFILYYLLYYIISFYYIIFCSYILIIIISIIINKRFWRKRWLHFTSTVNAFVADWLSRLRATLRVKFFIHILSNTARDSKRINRRKKKKKRNYNELNLTNCWSIDAIGKNIYKRSSTMCIVYPTRNSNSESQRSRETKKIQTRSSRSNEERGVASKWQAGISVG